MTRWKYRVKVAVVFAAMVAEMLWLAHVADVAYRRGLADGWAARDVLVLSAKR